MTDTETARRIGERHFCAAHGEACDAAFALALDGVAHERNDVGELNLAFERGGDRADFHFDDGGETVLACLLQRLASGNCGLERFRVVQQRPYFRSLGGQSHFARHRHGHRRFLP